MDFQHQIKFYKRPNPPKEGTREKRVKIATELKEKGRKVVALFVTEVLSFRALFFPLKKTCNMLFYL